VKRGLNKEVLCRGLYTFALFSACAGITVLTMSTLTSVAAGQSATTEQPSTYPEFPAGEGRGTVLRLCAKCHSPKIILAYGQNRLGWENTITKMARAGAEGSDEDFTDIADYLTTNFPPSSMQKIFVNIATDKQIASVLEISIDDAKAIIAYRDQIKGFKSIEELKKVPHVDQKKIDAKKDHLVFGFVSPEALRMNLN
jgi:competence protein ComEA